MTIISHTSKRQCFDKTFFSKYVSLLFQEAGMPTREEHTDPVVVGELKA